ncbi:MAG TPA: phospholipase D-like domain-containing protein [Saprospiraceae bacterium]|nr:phospholipase D-like domain-containing protein [Saprospiraceae bacterium]HMQ82954.1 phospholipase D-like domain-containing protein [Saprospiraceae bacterium]
MSFNDHQSHFENIREQLASELKRARHTIFAAVAWLTDEYLLDILTNKASEGVSIQLIISGSHYNEKSRFRSLTDAGGEVYTVGGGDVINDRFMHNKFCVIDYKKVVTGSFNWTKNASTNEENIVVINDERIAYQYSEKCIELIKRGEVIDFDSSNEIRISFFAPKTLVDSAESVKLEWKVENATEVSISNIGQLQPISGSHSVKINQDMTFVLTATDGEFKKSKTVFVRTIRYPKILSFAASEKAIVRGISLKLSWSVENAKRIEIDNGVGQVEANGEKQVSPVCDTFFTLTAYGETQNATKSVKVVVFPLPTITDISIPVPTKIRLETDIGLFENKVPTSLQLGNVKNDIIQRVPKIDFIFSDIQTNPPTIQEIASSLRKQAHDLTMPYVEKTGKLNLFKSAILDRLQIAFKNDWRASQVISQIRKTYGI